MDHLQDQQQVRAAELPDAVEVEDWGRVQVNSRCYGCMTCRVLSPEIFREAKAKSKSPFESGASTEVGKKIESREEFDAVRRAIFSCPPKAISWVRQPKVKHGELSSVYDGFPQLIEDDVYYMGFSDKTTFGCAGFFLRCGNGHNILIDPPIAHPTLVDGVNRLGGVQHLLFTHKDHTGNQEAWYRATKAPRLLHMADVVNVKNEYSPFPVTKDFEVLLNLKQLETITLDGVPDLRIISTPGHTAGSVMFLYKDKFLFTGDSLAYSHAKGHLHAHRVQTWQDWGIQTESLSGLKDYNFEWVLAGHGDWTRFETSEKARSDLEHCVTWMKEQQPGFTNLIWYILWTMVRPKRAGLKMLLCDSLILPQGAKDHLPNWTLSSRLLTMGVLLPIGALGVAKLRSSFR